MSPTPMNPTTAVSSTLGTLQLSPRAPGEGSVDGRDPVAVQAVWQCDWRDQPCHTVPAHRPAPA